MHPSHRMLPLLGLLAACEGPQSALDPAGRDAERIAELWWVMAAGAIVIWAVVIGLSVYATHFKPGRHGARGANLLIIGGGAAFPTIVLTVLLIYGLRMMPALLDAGPEGGVRIRVSGEQWWWRVHYELPDGRSFELANEVRLPVGERVPIRLESPDVNHAFWVPSLSGKIDMIPGRVNLIALEPTRAGVFRGACAEYCGSAHALMNFYAVAQSRPEFDAWMEEQMRPAAPPEGPVAEQGRTAFLANGCGACHTVRGTPADGTLGPDLTHVGSRVSLGAGILDNEVEEFARWIAHTDQIKPDVHMPSFHMLPEEDVRAIAIWLDGLR